LAWEEVWQRLQRERSFLRFRCTGAGRAVPDRILVLWASYPPESRMAQGPPGQWRLCVVHGRSMV
jgi:hypothetical protein